jgi:carboxyl-terminal processing protease
LIIDLRDNPGGLLNEAVSVADMFLERGQLIVSHRGRSSPERRYPAARGNRGLNVPLVVLVNGGSASASEIVSGAVQDHDRGLIVGEQTFGKGLVQTVSPLSQGTGLALTTARYYTPSGRLIQRDYKDVSLYDYLYNHKNPQPTEAKLTDGGRQVFGGGGITPDVMVSQPKLNAFQQLLMRRVVFYPFRGSVGSFTTSFLGTRPNITRDFVVDESVMNQFRRVLDKEKIPYSEPDIDANREWIERQIKKEVFLSAFGLQEGYQVQLENDPQVLKAIESIPQAKALYQSVRRLTAQRTGSQAN